MSDYTIGSGDCFARVAALNNYYNYRTLYDHPDNAAIKTKRPNPNQLAEGDVVKIPEKRQKTAALTLDGKNSFVVDRRKTKLRLVVTDSAKHPLVPTACDLRVGNSSNSNAPGGQGLIELEVDPTKRSGELKLRFAALPAPGAIPADPPPANPPANPPLIRESQYKEKPATAEIEELTVTWDLNIGYLQPKSTVRGTLQRLNNLTIETPVRDTENEKTKLYVKGYQAFQRAAAPDGAVSSIRDGLEQFHDTP